MARYVHWVNIFAQALSHSASALLTVAYIILVMVLIFASLMFYIENDHWDPLCGGTFTKNTVQHERKQCTRVRTEYRY